jgi:hypothetical protein
MANTELGKVIRRFVASFEHFSGSLSPTSSTWTHKYMYIHGLDTPGLHMHGLDTDYSLLSVPNPFSSDNMDWVLSSTYHLRYSTLPSRCFDVHWCDGDHICLGIRFGGHGLDSHGCVSTISVATLVKAMEPYLHRLDDVFITAYDEKDCGSIEHGLSGSTFSAWMPSKFSSKRISCTIEHSFKAWKNVSKLIDVWKDACDELNTSMAFPDLWR